MRTFELNGTELPRLANATLFAACMAACACSGRGPTLVAAPSISINPPSVLFVATEGITTSAQVISSANTGTGILSGLSAGVTYQSGAGWLSVDLSSTTAPATITISASATGLTVGRYAATISLTSTAPGVTNAPQTVAVTLIVRPAQTLAAGAYHTCGLTSAGAAYCWGWNLNGQLGNDGTVDSPVPVPVAGGLRFTTLSAGYSHTCGLTSTGAAYCWGYNSDGELGNAITTDSHVPVAVLGALTFATLGAGDRYTCGVTTDGTGYCWGSDANGQLGTAFPASTRLPVQIAGSHSFTEVQGGTSHTCGLTIAGAAFCWGDNFFYELGTGSVGYSAVPWTVSGGLTFTTLRTGTGPGHTCGLTSAGAAYCWGDDRAGQLGFPISGYGLPLPVVGGLSFNALSAGRLFTCAVANTGSAYCWGDNTYGQLGYDSFDSIFGTPGPVDGGLTFSSLSSRLYNVCGLSSAGAAYCWGDNTYGQLGNNSTTQSPAPVAVAGGLTFKLP